MPSDKSKFLAATVSSSQNGSHFFVKSRSDVKPLAVEIAETYVDSRAKRGQARYVFRYNLRTRDKTFSVGESVLVLTPDSTTSKVFSRWKGPRVVREIKSKTVIWWS